MKKFALVVTSCGCLLAFPTYAKVLFSDFSATYLSGDDYQVGDNKRQVLTLEYFAKTSWGDSFTFVDRLRSDNGDDELYGEFTPRFKLMEFEQNALSSLFIATSIEFGNFSSSNGVGKSLTNYLYGVGSQFKVPYFDFLNVNLFYRNNEHGENNYQTTISWGLPLGPFYYDGFMDYATSTDVKSPSMNLTSQLKYNVGKHLNIDNKVYLGVEYVYWQNKFGIDGVDEKNLNLLIKFHF